MNTINRTKEQWELYTKATAKDADTLNRAANRAVLDVLKEMQTEGVTLATAVNTALKTAQEKFLALADVGAYDTEPLWCLEYEVTSQFKLD